MFNVCAVLVNLFSLGVSYYCVLHITRPDERGIVLGLVLLEGLVSGRPSPENILLKNDGVVTDNGSDWGTELYFNSVFAVF